MDTEKWKSVLVPKEIYDEIKKISTTEGRTIVKRDLDWSLAKLDIWQKNVEKSENFIFFNTSEIN